MTEIDLPEMDQGRYDFQDVSILRGEMMIEDAIDYLLKKVKTKEEAIEFSISMQLLNDRIKLMADEVNYKWKLEEPITKKQLKSIRSIEAEFGTKFEGTTKYEAERFISTYETNIDVMRELIASRKKEKARKEKIKPTKQTDNQSVD